MKLEDIIRKTTRNWISGQPQERRAMIKDVFSSKFYEVLANNIKDAGYVLKESYVVDKKKINEAVRSIITDKGFIEQLTNLVVDYYGGSLWKKDEKKEEEKENK